MINGVAAVSVDVSADQIVIRNNVAGTIIFPSATEFRGVGLLDSYDEVVAFEAVTIGSVDTVLGFDSTRIDVAEDGIWINLAGMSFGVGGRIVLDVELA